MDRALIAAAVDAAWTRGCGRLYWVTHESTAPQRPGVCIDQVAVNSGFIRYQIAL